MHTCSKIGRKKIACAERLQSGRNEWILNIMDGNSSAFFIKLCKELKIYVFIFIF